MPEFLYRFRSVEKLLGTNEIEGELQGHYIYFASPQQLNDPFEGYRELFFSGDAIVWGNLLKRYISCLIVRNYQYLLKFDLNEKDFPDAYNLRTLPPEISVPGQRTISKFLSNKNVQRHINFLAESERKVTKEELIVHLSSLQVYAMKLVTSLYIKSGVKAVDTRLSRMDETSSLQSSTALLSVCERTGSTSVDPAEAIMYVVALHSTESQLFISNYKAYKESGESNSWRKLVHSFISQFVESLKKLSHRDWYTACFMESCSNSSIWGSYGNNHAGVCLKFKADNSDGAPKLSFVMPVALGPSGSIWKSTGLKFEKVQYDNSVLDLDFFRSIGIYDQDTLLENWYLNEKGDVSSCYSEFEDKKGWIERYWTKRQLSITTKMQDWKNESEYRLILQNGMPDFYESKNRCLSYNFNSLDGLIFGIRTPEIEKYELIKVVEKLCDKYHRTEFNIYQAYHDTYNKCIGYRPLLKVECKNPKAQLKQ